jgi:hypothetical protein
MKSIYMTCAAGLAAFQSAVMAVQGNIITSWMLFVVALSCFLYVIVQEEI